MAQHLKLQAHSHLKSNSVAKPFSQAHIHFQHPDRDGPNVSQRTMAILRAIMTKSNVSEIWVTSTVRSPSDQAKAMLHDMEHPAIDPETHKNNRINYQGPGSVVNIIGAIYLTNNFSNDVIHKVSDLRIQHEMAMTIRAVGPQQVSNHVASKTRQTVDFILGRHSTRHSDAVVSYVRSLVVQKIVSGFGWPQGPKPRQGMLFRDGKCFHIEIPQ